jgi:hypothetical protein
MDAIFARRIARGLALLLPLTLFGACGNDSSKESSSSPLSSCEWPAEFDAVDAAPSGQCRDAHRYFLSCEGNGVTELCLSDDQSCHGASSLTGAKCESQCEEGEYAMVCGSIGVGLASDGNTDPPSACRMVAPTPGGIVFVCCPCGS